MVMSRELTADCGRQNDRHGLRRRNSAAVSRLFRLRKRGWARDFLLLVDGWAKDRDANTAHGQSTEPLPFHAMSQFPYGANEQFPGGSGASRVSPKLQHAAGAEAYSAFALTAS